MPNMSPTKNPMPHLPPNIRNRNFDEVALGFTHELAQSEAERCLSCKNPACVEGCPVKVDIPGFISKIRLGDINAAFDIISQDSSLPAVCGRVCPQEKQCELHCVRAKAGDPVAIGRLERFAADNYEPSALPEASPLSNSFKVAIIGSGPAGLTCAGDLARRGYEITVFEALHIPGGVLVYGIPQFRLPKEIVSREIQGLRNLGVSIVTSVAVGKALSVDELFDLGYHAVFIASGAGLPGFMRIPGENLNGVYSANEFLTRVNLMKAYKPDARTPVQKGRRVAVIGGGNVAMDAARCAIRLGAEKVFIIYRRSEEEMPARREEVNHAKEEGIVFENLSKPVEILANNGFVSGIKCVKMSLAEPDSSGRRAPVTIENSDYILDVDQVIVAIGTSPNPLISETTDGLKVNARGCIEVDAGGATSREGVFAGGDAVTGAATVILAMGAGKSAARSIDLYIKSRFSGT